MLSFFQVATTARGAKPSRECIEPGSLTHVGLVWKGEKSLWNRFNWELQ